MFSNSRSSYLELFAETEAKADVGVGRRCRWLGDPERDVVWVVEVGEM